MVELLGIVIAVAVLRVSLRANRPVGARLMSAGDVFGLIVSLLVLAYLLYVLFRGEKL